MSASPVLDVHDLRVELRPGAPIVEEVTLSVAAGEILGLVGESGCGKTTTALALLGFERPGARITGGTIAVAGVSVTDRVVRSSRSGGSGG